MARLARQAFAVVWVNPLKRRPAYQPLAGGMRAALPLIDRFFSGHDVASLETLGRCSRASSGGTPPDARRSEALLQSRPSSADRRAREGTHACRPRTPRAPRARRRGRRGRADRHRLHVHRGPDLDARRVAPLQRHAGRQAPPLAPRARASTVLRDPSNKCNGMTLDNDGNLIVCEHVTSSVVRERPDGTRETLATHWRQGAEQPERRDRRARRLDHLHRPDLRPHARLRDRARAGARLPGRLPASRRTAASSSCSSTTSRSRTGSASRPTSRCSTSTTPTARTSASSTSAPSHALSNGRVFAEGIGTGDLAKGELVDGMKLDERGNVYVTGPEGRLGLRARTASTSA